MVTRKIQPSFFPSPFEKNVLWKITIYEIREKSINHVPITQLLQLTIYDQIYFIYTPAHHPYSHSRLFGNKFHTSYNVIKKYSSSLKDRFKKHKTYTNLTIL